MSDETAMDKDAAAGKAAADKADRNKDRDKDVGSAAHAHPGKSPKKRRKVNHGTFSPSHGELAALASARQRRDPGERTGGCSWPVLCMSYLSSDLLTLLAVLALQRCPGANAIKTWTLG